jgi:glycosyltransferase involved in cell wall biosynthesis
VCVPILELATVALDYGESTGTPVILDIRDRWPDIYLTVLPPRLRGLGRRALSGVFEQTATDFRRATALTAISSSDLDWALALSGRTRAELDRVVPMGYDDDLADRYLAPSDHLESGIMRVVFAGSFGRQFDFETVLESARDLERTCPGRFHFDLLGSGPTWERVYARARASTNISMPGWVNQDVLWRYLSIASVGLTPYRPNAIMSIPNKPIEYLAAGLPIANSLSGELADLIEREQVGHNYAGSTQLTGLLKHWSDPLIRSAVSAKSRGLYETRFRSSVVYADLAAHLERVVSQCSRA